MLTQSSGWQLTLSHPDTGRTVAPDVLGDPEFLPSLNSLVEVRIPVRRSPDWVEWPDGTDMELRLDGRVQPVDELVDIEQEAGRTVLVGEGGTELEDRVTAEYQSERRHIAAGELIEANTTYAADVDTPDFGTLTDETLVDADTTAEFEAAGNFSASTPADTSGDDTRLYRTCHTTEAEAADTLDGAVVQAGSNYSGDAFASPGGEALRFTDDGAAAEWDVSWNYDISENGWDVGVRYAADPGDIEPEFEITWTINGGHALTFSPSTGGAETHIWEDRLWQNEGGGTPAVDAGESVTIRAEVTGVGGSSSLWFADVIAPYEGDPSEYVFDNTVTTIDDANYLDGPGYFPAGRDIAFADAETAFSITTGKADITIPTDTDGPQRIQLSNDRGATWLPGDGSETGATSIDVSFPTTGAALRFRATFGGASPDGPKDQTPRENYESEAIDSLLLRADIEQESLLIDAVFDDSLESILNEIAGDEYVWSYRIENGTPTVSWTQPGQRTADREPDFEANVSVTKQLRTWDAVTIQGSAQTVSSEPFDASETFTELVRDRIIPGSESVVDPSDGTQFVRGDDYEMRYLDGEIRLAADSDMVAATEYNIDYRYEAQGIHPPDYTGLNTLVETIPGIVSDRQAEQIAYVLLEIDPGVDSPRWTADVLLPRADSTFDPLKALSLVALELPDDATPLSVREPPDVTPEGIALRLGSRRALESALRSISSQVQTVSRRS